MWTKDGILGLFDIILITRYMTRDRGPDLIEGVTTVNGYEEVTATLMRGESVLNVSGLPDQANTNLSGKLFGGYVLNNFREDVLLEGLDPRLNWATVQANIEAYMP